MRTDGGSLHQQRQSARVAAVTIWILALDLLSAATQIAGFALLIVKGWHARRMLRAGTWNVIDGGGPDGQPLTEVSSVSVIDLLLRDAAGTWWAFALIAAGISAGAASSVLQFMASS